MFLFRTSVRLIAAALVVTALIVATGVGGRLTLAQSSGDVTIADFSYSSATITIDQGRTVTWTNTGAAPHSATGDGVEFDTGIIGSGDSVSITFDKPGTYTYHCSVHPNMVAAVVVLSADDGDDDPVTELPDTGSGFSGQQGESFAVDLGALSFLLMIGSFGLRRRQS